MQTTMQAFKAAPAQASTQPRARKALAVSCSAQPARKSLVAEGAKTLAAGLAAAALFVGVPSADAGVILTKSEVKNLVQDSAPAAKGAAPAKKAPTAKRPAAAETSEGFDPKPLALPLSLVLIAGGAAAVKALDPEFEEFMVEWGAKDSRSYAGYETALKDTPFFGGSGSIPTSAGGASKAAPKKAATTKKGTKKGGSGLGSIFGSRD